MTTRTLRRIGRHLRAQWAGLLTIVVFLTLGTAHALPGRNTVYSGDLVDGQVSSADVADNSLDGDRDIRALASSDIARNGLGADRVDESSLGVVPVAVQAGAGSGGSGSCRESSSYVDCGTLWLTLGKPGRLLIVAAVRTKTSLFVDDVRGPCRLEVNGAPIEASETRFRYDDEGELSPTTTPREGAGQQATLTAVSHVYPPGRHLVGVECALIGSDSIYGDGGSLFGYVSISAVGLSDR